jgi:hypothetical protein
MFITKKQHAKDLDKLQHNFNYALRNLDQDNRMLSARISGLEKDLIAIKKYFNIELVTVPSEYIAKAIK